MIGRRSFIAAALAVVVAPRGAGAQRAASVPRVGFLWASTPEPRYLEAFRSGLQGLGWTEGKSILVEQRSAANVVQRLDGLAKELVDLRVDVIVTQGTPAARAAGRATKTIPIVIALGEPVGARLVASLSHPGGNITGLTVLSNELNAKRLELLREIKPKMSRLALLFDPTTTDPDGAPLVGPAQIEPAARSLGLRVQYLAVRGPDDFDKAFAAASEARAEAVLVSPSPVLSFHNKALIGLAAKYRLPAIYGNPESVALGGLMSYGPSYTALFRRAATYVSKILRGAKPGDLPIEQPTSFELLINLKTAKTLVIAVPRSVVLRADQVIE